MTREAWVVSRVFSGAWFREAPWRIAAVAGGVAALFALIGLIAFIRRLRHDKRLESEVRRERTRPAPSAAHAQITVVPENRLTAESENLFMPVPGQVSGVVEFTTRERDGVEVLDSVRDEEVNRLMSDETAERLVATVFRPGTVRSGKRAVVYLDTLSDRFGAGSFVDLKILKRAHLVDEDAATLTVYANGTLRKPLMIEADDFSCEAVKMISLTGGRAILIRAS